MRIWQGSSRTLIATCLKSRTPRSSEAENNLSLSPISRQSAALQTALPIYSGGLGILSGDHLKSASDLRLPVVGISLAYQKGYFRQYLIQDGWQMESYPVNQFNTMPMHLVRDGEGKPVTISVDLKDELVRVQAWQVNIGRTSLYLLDTNMKENSEWARTITSQLYGGDREMRIRQEIILGVGGVRMLKAMGLQPAVYHMNEGHSAFTVFERIRQLREDRGLSFNEAVELVRVTSVFTTHTPVPAGIDTFHPDLMRAYFENFAKAMGISIARPPGFRKTGPEEQRRGVLHGGSGPPALQLEQRGQPSSRPCEPSNVAEDMAPVS